MIRRRRDVGLAPAQELLTDVNGRRAVSERRTRAPNGQRRPEWMPIADVDTPRSFDLIVRVDPRVESGRELKPRPGLETQLTASLQINDQEGVVLWRLLGKPHAARVDETALGDCLRGKHRRTDHHKQHKGHEGHEGRKEADRKIS